MSGGLVGGGAVVVLDPARVALAGEALTGVRSVTIDRDAERLLEEWDDQGEHCAFVDVPEVRTIVKIVRLVGRDELGPAAEVGRSTFMECAWSADASGGGGVRVSAGVVVVGITHVVPSAEHATRATPGVVQTIEMRGVSSTTSSDPVSYTTDEGVA